MYPIVRLHAHFLWTFYSNTNMYTTFSVLSIEIRRTSTPQIYILPKHGTFTYQFNICVVITDNEKRTHEQNVYSLVCSVPVIRITGFCRYFLGIKGSQKFLHCLFVLRSPIWVSSCNTPRNYNCVLR